MPRAERSTDRPTEPDHFTSASDKQRIYSQGCINTRKLSEGGWDEVINLVLDALDASPAAHDKRVVRGNDSDDVYSFRLEEVDVLEEAREVVCVACGLGGRRWWSWRSIYALQREQEDGGDAR